MLKAMQKENIPASDDSLHLEINPKHPLIKNLTKIKTSQPDIAKLIALQILETSKVSAGLIEDPSALVQQNYKIMEHLSNNPKLDS